MTVIAAVRSDKAIVFASDSEERSATTRRSTTKILRPQPGLALAWAGYKDVAQAMALSLAEEPLDLALPRSKVAHAAKGRFKLLRSDPDVEHRSDTNEFMLGWYCAAEHKPVGLHLRSGGTAVWVEQWEYAGSPAAVATARVVEAAISYVATEDLGVEQLSLVALKVLRDCITAAPPNAGVGGDVQLATITIHGIRVLAPAELRAGNDALDVWQERCAELLPGAAVRPGAETRADTGLRPPR